MYVSGYEMAKLVSTKLGREIRPQMIYNYMKKGKIVSELVGGTRKVSLEEVANFIRNFESKTSKVSRNDLLSALDELL
jgi:hypothetical protein